MINVNWIQLKAQADTRSCSVQFVDRETFYELYVLDGPLEFSCTLDKNDPPSPDQEDFETNYKSNGNKNISSRNMAFADKVLLDGKKLYGRVHGVSSSVQNAPDNIDFVVPYDNCKITGIEIIGCNIGDTVNFKVIDTPTGTISGVPNYMLNQFGFNVATPEGYYKREFSYDADLIKDMKLRLEYDAKDELLPKTIYVNFIIHEVKD